MSGTADLWAPLDTLTVDEATLRAKAGFETEPSAQDIAGTRKNMMGRVLETDRHPFALIAVSDLGSGGSSIRLRIDITLHGTTRSLGTDAEFERSEDELSVSGVISIDQSEFGIVPLSVLGGAIAVQDRLNISNRIRASRIQWPGRSLNPEEARQLDCVCHLHQLGMLYRAQLVGGTALASRTSYVAMANFRSVYSSQPKKHSRSNAARCSFALSNLLTIR
jgi:hypothetical protein